MKMIKVLDRIVDYIYRIIFIMIILVGLYYVFDTAYIFYNATGNRLLARLIGENNITNKVLTEDYIATLKIDDTNIDHPIMQGKTNASYLNRNPYGEFSLSGSIFLDCRNKPDFSDSYSLIYGHHMANGFMFGALDEFFDKEYWKDHQKGTITLKDGTVLNLDIFACLKTDANNDAVFNPEGSDILLSSLPVSQFYKIPKNYHIVVLSTCMEPGSTNRTIVLACIV